MAVGQADLFSDPKSQLNQTDAIDHLMVLAAKAEGYLRCLLKSRQPLRVAFSRTLGVFARFIRLPQDKKATKYRYLRTACCMEKIGR